MLDDGGAGACAEMAGAAPTARVQGTEHVLYTNARNMTTFHSPAERPIFVTDSDETITLADVCSYGLYSPNYPGYPANIRKERVLLAAEWMEMYAFKTPDIITHFTSNTIRGVIVTRLDLDFNNGEVIVAALESGYRVVRSPIKRFGVVNWDACFNMSYTLSKKRALDFMSESVDDERLGS